MDCIIRSNPIAANTAKPTPNHASALAVAPTEALILPYADTSASVLAVAGDMCYHIAASRANTQLMRVNVREAVI